MIMFMMCLIRSTNLYDCLVNELKPDKLHYDKKYLHIRLPRDSAISTYKQSSVNHKFSDVMFHINRCLAKQHNMCIF